MKKVLLPAAAVAGLLFCACSKKDSTPDTTPAPVATAADIMTAHTWKIDTIAFDTDKNGSIDMAVPGGLKPCDLDNTLTFKKDSTGLFDEGGSKCVDSVAQTTPFTWNLSNSDSVVNITGIPGQLNGVINVLTLNDSSLIMSKPIPYNNNTTVNLIVALKK